jgi:hypothetical protein
LALDAQPVSVWTSSIHVGLLVQGVDRMAAQCHGQRRVCLFERLARPLVLIVYAIVLAGSYLYGQFGWDVKAG